MAWLRRRRMTITGGALALLLAAYWTWQGIGYVECRQDGGRYVAGVGVYECVEGR